jgi:hypothetical protein
MLKEQGIVAEKKLGQMQGKPFRPMIKVSTGCKGCFIRNFKADVNKLLTVVGVTCCYGLRSIELHPRPLFTTGPSLRLGRLIVPGRIIIYDAPQPPWTIAGRLPPSQYALLSRAGATIQDYGEGVQSVVIWQEKALRAFMLFDILLHEVGHHIIQHHKGKRSARVVRTSDHEAFADLFSERCRQLYQDQI